MTLVSPGFFIFLFAALAVYFITPSKFRWVTLLAGSYLFYFLMGGWGSLIAVNLAAVIIWWVGARLNKIRGQSQPADGTMNGTEKHDKNFIPHGVSAVKKRLRGMLMAGVALLFFLLAAVRQADFIAAVGASFYVFQATGYLIDIYAGKIKAERNFFKLALFLSFFPQLVQGPITRFGQVAADLFAGHGWDWDRARHGVQRIIWGYFLKLVIADRCAVAVNAVFESPEAYGGAVILFALLLYAVQVFGDFAGGISMMVGVGEIVGVKLPENFRQPFFAVSVSDFWRRWHITLGAWLKDYLFYPIALSKPIGRLGIWARKVFGLRAGKLIPATVATFAVYFVMGLWHGATWQGFAFGILNGLIISVSQFLWPGSEKKSAEASRPVLWYAFAVTRTFIIMLFLRVFVRASSMSGALLMLGRVVTSLRPVEIFQGMLLSLGLSAADYLVLAFGVIIMLAAEIAAERGRDIFKLSDNAPVLIQGAGLLFILGFITVFGLYSGNASSAAFIYGQF